MSLRGRYDVATALSSMGQNRGRTALAVLTVMTPLYVLGSFGAIWWSLAPAVRALKSEAHLVIFLKDGVSDAGRESVVTSLGRREVRRFRYVPPEEAARRLSGLLGRGGAPAPETELPAAVLPASYEVVLTSAATREPGPLLEEIRGLPAVDEVAEQLELARRLSLLLSLVAALGSFLGLVLTAAAFVTVSNVVKLLFHARQEEVSVLKVVGASDHFVRAPFLVEGSLLGLGGGLLAAAALLITRGLLGATLGHTAGLLGDLVSQLRTPALLLLAMVVLGAAIGRLSAHLALAGLLRPPED